MLVRHATSTEPAAGSEGRSRATTAGLVAVALWCWSGPALAAGSRALGPMLFLALACGLGVVTGVLREVGARGSVRRLLLPPPRVALAGAAGIGLYTLLLVSAMGMVEDRELGQIVLVNYLWPVLIVLLSALLLEDRPPLGPLLVAAGLGLAGVMVARGQGAFAAPPRSLLPHGLALAGATLWALYSVLLRRWRVPPEQSGATLPFVLCGAVAALLAAARGETSRLATLDAGAALWLVLYGVGAVGLGYPLWELGMKRGAAGLLAVAAYFIPVVSAGLMALLFRESAGAELALGAALTTAGAIVASRAARPRGSPPSR